MNERKAITDWLRSRRASEPMRLTIERLAELIDQGKHLEQSKEEGEKTNFETYLEEQLKNPEVRKAFEQGGAEAQRVALAWERERFDRLWQLEMDICKCEEAMQHLKVRMERTQGGIDYKLEFGDNE